MPSIDFATVAAVALVVSPPLVGIGWVLVEEWVWPWRTPQAVIEAMADEAERRAPGHPVGYALAEIDHGWWRSDFVARGLWRRVLRTLERRARARRAAGRG